jgi:hypothetical protein
MIHSYRGGCQCGAVLYDVELDLATTSPGTKSVWQRVVRPSAFTLIHGEDQLRGYQYGDAAPHHFFCTSCGEHAYSREAHAHGLRYVVDVRALRGRKPPARQRAVQLAR